MNGSLRRGVAVGFAVLVVGCAGIVAGTNGVRTGAIPVRIEVHGATLAPDIVDSERWYTRHPGGGGWIELWPGNETVERPVAIDGSTATAALPVGSWCFFPQEFEAARIGTVELFPVTLPYGGPCTLVDGDRQLAVSVDASSMPSCLAYVAAQTTAIRVSVDATPINVLFAHRIGEGPGVRAGVETAFALGGYRTPSTWPASEQDGFDAPLSAVYTDVAAWDRIAGSAGPNGKSTVTRAVWAALGASETSEVWGIRFDGDRFLVTPPPDARGPIHVAVAGFGPEDDRTMIWDAVLEVRPP